jgi:uncharacterized protein YneF (UPF0154 family)
MGVVLVLIGTGFCLGVGVGAGIWLAMRVLERWS